MRIVDGGYLSWIYGAETFARNFWPQVRGQYTMFSGSVVMMEGEGSNRADLFPMYKGHRADRRKEKPRLKERHAAVASFRTDLNDDPGLLTMSEPGWEADDLVAAAYLYFPLLATDITVIGKDKDLLQLWGIQLESVKGDVVTLDRLRNKYPKAIWPSIRQADDVLPVLSMFGDDSDNIPRIIPPRTFDTFNKIMKEPTGRFQRFYEEYGQQVIDNLYITVLPGPWCLEGYPDPHWVLEAVDRQEYSAFEPKDELRGRLDMVFTVLNKLGNGGHW